MNLVRCEGFSTYCPVRLFALHIIINNYYFSQDRTSMSGVFSTLFHFCSWLASSSSTCLLESSWRTSTGVERSWRRRRELPGLSRELARLRRGGNVRRQKISFFICPEMKKRIVGLVSSLFSYFPSFSQIKKTTLQFTQTFLRPFLGRELKS